MILSQKMALCVRPSGVEAKEILHLGPALTPFQLSGGLKGPGPAPILLSISAAQQQQR